MSTATWVALITNFVVIFGCWLKIWLREQECKNSTHPDVLMGQALEAFIIIGFGVFVTILIWLVYFIHKLRWG